MNYNNQNKKDHETANEKKYRRKVQASKRALAIKRSPPRRGCVVSTDMGSDRHTNGPNMVEDTSTEENFDSRGTNSTWVDNEEPFRPFFTPSMAPPEEVNPTADEEFSWTLVSPKKQQNSFRKFRRDLIVVLVAIVFGAFMNSGYGGTFFFMISFFFKMLCG
jgi:hypothetical protein